MYKGGSSGHGLLHVPVVHPEVGDEHDLRVVAERLAQHGREAARAVRHVRVRALAEGDDHLLEEREGA